MFYSIQEVDGTTHQDTLNAFNRLAPDVFPPLHDRHFERGFWWLAYHDEEPVAFAGMVPFGLPGVGYFKRCFVKARGHGLQFRLMVARELKARQLGWTCLVSECHAGNLHSANNFRRAGFEQFDPEQPWAKDSIYWRKVL